MSHRKVPKGREYLVPPKPPEAELQKIEQEKINRRILNCLAAAFMEKSAYLIIKEKGKDRYIEMQLDGDDCEVFNIPLDCVGVVVSARIASITLDDLHEV